MGWLGRLFGRSDVRDADTDRCNECGMAGGRHTAWCPLAEAERKEPPGGGPRASSTRGEGGTEAPA